MPAPVRLDSAGMPDEGAWSDPAIDLVPINLSSADQTIVARAIRCRGDGVAGALKVTTAAGNDRTTYISAGETLVLSITKVFKTGTAATNLEALI